ncbi:MAG: hypothetical protein ABJM75_00005 [Luteolibacter sp.]
MKKILLGTAFFTGAITSQAAILVSWNFDAISGTTNLNPTGGLATIANSGVIAQPASSGAGFTLATTPSTLFTSQGNGLQTNTTNNAAGQTVAVNNNEYFSLILWSAPVL